MLHETMLTIEELNAMDDLSANILYAVEVARLASLSLAQEQELVLLARKGSEDAKADLIVSVLHYALGKARAAYNLKQFEHDDLLDLVQVASLAMLESLDRALQRANPVSYLRGIARRSIALYWGYRRSLVSKPAGLTRKQIEKRGPVVVESLDAPLVLDGTLIRLDVVAAPMSDPAAILEAEESPAERQARYAALHSALATLSPHERQVLTLRFGLDGQPGMGRENIGGLIGGTYNSISNIEHRALDHLRSALKTQEVALTCSDSEEA